jgi:hypothetical protein
MGEVEVQFPRSRDTAVPILNSAPNLGQLHAPFALSLGKERALGSQTTGMRIRAGWYVLETERACSTRNLVTLLTELPGSCDKQ